MIMNKKLFECWEEQSAQSHSRRNGWSGEHDQGSTPPFSGMRDKMLRAIKVQTENEWFMIFWGIQLEVERVAVDWKLSNWKWTRCLNYKIRRFIQSTTCTSPNIPEYKNTRIGLGIGKIPVKDIVNAGMKGIKFGKIEESRQRSIELKASGQLKA